MKKKLIRAVFLFFAVAFCLGFLVLRDKQTTSGIRAAEKLFDKEALNFWVITDPHYIDETLYDSGSAFEAIKTTTAGKDLTYQKESLQALIAELIEKKPDGLVVTGDITLNGEKVSGEKFAELFDPVREAGVGVFVIPGNHDINDGWARKFVADSQEKTEQISPSAFKQLFADFGYEQANAQDEHSLSYRLSVNDTYDFLFLDSNIYSMTSSNQKPTTSGEISDETIKWLKEQLEMCTNKQKKPIIFMHHNLFAHNTFVSTGYVLNNAEELIELFQEHQVSICFSGHIHAQDILTDETSGITEIVTGSYAITPNPVGQVTLTANKITYARHSVDVAGWAAVHQPENRALLEHQEYLKQLFFDESCKISQEYIPEVRYEDSKQKESVAAFVAELNVRFFTGEEAISSAEVETIRKTPEYQFIKKESPTLQKYLESIMQDTNENDLLFERNLE